MPQDPRYVRFVRFELTLPLRYNSPSPGILGDPIPQQLMDEARAQLRRRFRGLKRWVGEGDSFYPESGHEYVGEPEQYFRVNVPLEDAGAAWEWFQDHCCHWADLFQQEEIYLEIPELGIACRFRSKNHPGPQPDNPFSAGAG